MIAGSVGSDFSEEFKLPASDSQEAFDLLETKFPAQSGDTATIVFKADGGVESPAVKKKMEGVFAEVAKLPHVSEVASPYGSGGAAAISDDGKIAYATVQYDVHHQQARKRRRSRSSSSTAARRSGRRPPGRARRPADRGSPRRRRRRRLLLRDRPAGGDGHPAADLRLGGRDGAADHHRAVRARRRAQPGHRSAPTSSTPPTSRRNWRR